MFGFDPSLKKEQSRYRLPLGAIREGRVKEFVVQDIKISRDQEINDSLDIPGKE